MLFGIPALLTPEILSVLHAMGHGDELVLADVNFPSASTAAETIEGEAYQLTGVNAATAIKAILEVFPLDAFVAAPALRMEVDGRPDFLAAAQVEVQEMLTDATGGPWELTGVERFLFYERARRAYAVIRTGERRPFGCFILKKGVIADDGALLTPEKAAEG